MDNRGDSMKSFLSGMIIFASLILVGCSDNLGVVLNNEKYEKATFSVRNIYADTERSCFCVVDKADIEKMLDAAHRKDAEYLDNMLTDGRAFVVREITKVKCSNSEIRRGMVLVNFLEGEFKGRWAYTFSIRVR